MRMKAKNARRLLKVVHAINIGIALTKMAPALLLWLLTLGALNVDFREDWATQIVDIPGWSDHELTWYVSRRFLITMDVQVLK
jgi:hypothetical protein